jgi:S-adenosylmethionine-diacylglycerol 3-amino-3-carboxypropyl transferase
MGPMAELTSTVADSVLATSISYAQCWEDPAVLQAALAVGPDDDVLSITSAGDNSFALSIAGARSVTCIDLSFPQTALAELKLLAVRELPVQSVRSLFGLGHFGRRVWFYHFLREKLRPPVREYWDRHEEMIRLGLLGQGRFEQYLETFRTRVLPLVHRRETIERLLGCTTLDEQRAVFDAHWNTWRWRSLFRLFFSRTVMSRTGRSKAHFAQVEGEVSSRFLARAQHALTEIPVKDNFFLRWMLSGEHGDLEHGPAWLTTAGHARLRERADSIRFVRASLEDFLPGGGEKFSAFNFSNLFEYVPAEHHEKLLELAVERALPGARFAYWNLLVPRFRPDRLADRIVRDEALAARLHATDRAFVYGGFQVERVR